MTHQTSRHDDWQAGDLALCVALYDGGGIDPPPANLKIGGVYTVERVFCGVDLFGGAGLGLAIVDVQPLILGAQGFVADLFRKIHPHTPDAEDREAIELLTGKPVEVAA